MRSFTLIIIFLMVFTSGCAVSQKDDVQITNSVADEEFGDSFDLLNGEIEEKKVEIDDPIEPVNRVMFVFNDRLYLWVLEPTAKLYKDIAPLPARVGIRNFFDNITTPVRFVNCHLQGKTSAADTELYRFLVNTSVGIAGFGDPAKDRFNIQPMAGEDLGQSLAKFGLGNGFYVVLPFFGPSTLRDVTGTAGDLFLNPTFYIEPTEAAIGVSALKFTNNTSFRIGEYQEFKSAALDPYIAMRNAYIQYRNEQIKK